LLGDNGAHGFALPLPSAYANGTAHTLTVHFESSSTLLGGGTVNLSCGGSGAVNYVGSTDVASCSGISGWAADRNRPSTPINVTLWDGSTQIASTTANGSRPDVGAALGDNGLHGFTFSIPAGYANGTHSLQARYESSSTPLPGGSVTLSCGSSGP